MMTIEEIRKNAPRTATHYKISARFIRDDEVVYYQKCGVLWFQKITDSIHIVCDQRTILVDEIKPLSLGAFLLNKTLYNQFY